MKRLVRTLYFIVVLLALSVCLFSCAEKTIKIGIDDLESGCIEKKINRDDMGVFVEYRLKKGCGATELKEDFEARYGGDGIYTFTAGNNGRSLAISRIILNKFDKRLRESWMFQIDNGNYIVYDTSSLLTKSANDADHSGEVFFLPIKYMDYPELLYIGYEEHEVYVYEGVRYAVRCGFTELKTYYERLGFYKVAEEGENTLLLTLNRQDDDLAQFNDREFEKSVRLVFESVDSRENGGITGYFRAETVPHPLA